MKKHHSLFLFGITLLFISACSNQDQETEDAIAEGIAATQTKQAWEVSQESARQTETAAVSTEEQIPEIIHVLMPGEPTETNNTFVTDFNSIDFASDGFTYGDQFFINRYERPFTIEMAEYRGYLDLILTNLKVNPPWIYAVIYLAEDLPETSNAIYSLEFDTDKDGRGDFLVRAAMPVDENWTVTGVSVFEDGNEDVGGENPVLADLPDEISVSDGFEIELFNEGVGADADLAWVRRNAEDPTSLEIALKQSLVGEGGFLWSVWADEGLRDPSLRDYNDRYTFEDAGSPYPEHQFYPIREINLVDSTCSSWYGFEPTGDEVGLCQVYTPDTPGKGYKICLSYNFGNQTIVNCDTVCREECPPQLPSGYFCERCTLPE